MRHEKLIRQIDYIVDCLDHLRAEAQTAGLGEVAMLIELTMTAAFDAAGPRLVSRFGGAIGPAAHPR